MLYTKSLLEPTRTIHRYLHPIPTLIFAWVTPITHMVNPNTGQNASNIKSDDSLIRWGYEFKKMASRSVILSHVRYIRSHLGQTLVLWENIMLWFSRGKLLCTPQRNWVAAWAMSTRHKSVLSEEGTPPTGLMWDLWAGPGCYQKAGKPLGASQCRNPPWPLLQLPSGSCPDLPHWWTSKMK